MIKFTKKELALWGKKNEVDGQYFWLPLIVHLIDTKNVITFLYTHWLDDGQRKLIEQNLGPKAENIIQFLGYIHDIGKATPAFQIKQSRWNNSDLDQEIIEHLLKAGFKDINDKLPLAEKSPHNFAGEAILLNYGVEASFAALLGGHHGKPCDHNLKNDIADHTANYYQKDLDTDVQEVWKKIQLDFFEFGLEECGLSNASEIPKIKQEIAVELEGLLIMADWLASSEYFNEDKSLPMFNLIPLTDEEFILDKNWLKRRFQRAIKTWFLDGVWMPQRISDIDAYFREIWNFSPRHVQKEMLTAIRTIIEPGIIVIEAPMGIGKTEIALAAAQQVAAVKGKSGVFVGLPTQATSNAMFSRVKTWLNTIGQEQGDRFSINLAHSKAGFNMEFSNLPLAENMESEETDTSVSVNQWFLGKKSVLSKFNVGTIDNLLQMGLKQRHLFLKHLGFADKVIIIDEVHSYDAYMSSYLKKVLTWLGAYDVPVILLSATLPYETREDLVKAYLAGKCGISVKKLTKVISFERKTDYPLLTFSDGDKVNQLADFKQDTQQKIEVVRLKLDDQELGEKILDEISEGGIAGVIVNTVARAQTLARIINSLDANVNLLVLHSSFLSSDRARLETKLQQLIGKNLTGRPKQLVVIGTQVLEQSLDIDFDVLFTDIAPMDLLMQRIGRLQRHHRVRPENLQQARVFVSEIEKFGCYGDANQLIYSRYILMKTDYYLPAEIEIPTDISKLVNLTYSSEIFTRNDLSSDEIKDLKIAKDEEDLYIEKEKQKASNFQIAAPKSKKLIRGWLELTKPINELVGDASVRDIEDSIEVVLLKKTDTDVTLLNGESIEFVDSSEIAGQTIRLPHRLTFNIESTINVLEKQTSRLFPEWATDPWLKRSLAFCLDENNRAIFNGYKVTYDQLLGLVCEKE